MKILYNCQRLAVMFIGIMLLSGCTTIKFEFKFHPDFATDFSESIWLDQDLSGFLGTSQLPGDADYWSQIRRLAKTFSWNCKEKASNHLVLSGACRNGQQYDVSKQLANQIAVFAAASGIPVSAELVGPAVIKYRAVKIENFFSEENRFYVDLDLTVNAARKFMALPPQLVAMLNAPEKDRAGIKINAKAKFPIEILSTNGQVEANTNSVTWPIYLGQLNHFEVAFRIIKWPIIALVVVAVVSTVIGLFFAFLGSRRNG